MEQVRRDDPQRREAVDDGPLEVDRAGLGEVAGGDGDLGDAEAGPDDLADQLLVEDEVVGVGW